MKKTHAGIYIALIASSAISVGVIASASFSAEKELAKIGGQMLIAKARDSVCIPQTDASLGVGGLGRSDVPRMPNATRTNYSDNGFSQYLAHQKSEDILNYYAAKLPKQCWKKIKSRDPKKAEWKKDNLTLNITLKENPFGGRTQIDYQILQGKVLGETFRAADACPAAPTGCAYGYFFDPVTNCPTSCAQAPADAPPTITALVKSANSLHPDTIYAGLKSYISVAFYDDKGLTYGGFNAPGMRYSAADVELSQCRNGVTSCAEQVYIIVPDKSGPYTITVKATDTASQTTTQTITFTAAGCSADSECGGTYFPNSGATFCDNTGLKVMKYGIIAKCSSGSCDEKSEPAVYQDCTQSNQICEFSTLHGGQYQCIAGTPAPQCVTGNKITSRCLCGSQVAGGAYYTWSGYDPGYCCNDGTNYFTTTAGCPAPTNCTGPYTQTNAKYSCNFSTCPAGCYYDGATGCANGCITNSQDRYNPTNTSTPNTQNTGTSGGGGGGTSSTNTGATSGGGGTTNNVTAPAPAPTPIPVQNIPSPSQVIQCPVCQGYREGQCVNVAAGTRDTGCGPNGVCDGNGKCKTDAPALPPPTPIPERIKIDDSRFNAIKSGLRDWENAAAKIEKQSKQIERRIRAKNCKVNLPPEIKSIEKARQIIAKIKSAKTPDEIESLVSEMQDVSDAFTELGNVLGRLVGLCDTIKQAERDIKTITRNYKKIASSVKKYPNIEELAGELKTLVDTMTQTLQNTKELAKTDPASALDAIETFYDSIEEVWTLISQINMIQDLPKGIKQIQDEIKRVEKIIAAMKKAPEYDTALMNELTELIAELKENLAEAQTLSKQKPINKEALQEAIQTLWESFEELENKLSEQGQGLYRKKILSKEEAKLAPPPGWDFKQ